MTARLDAAIVVGCGGDTCEWPACSDQVRCRVGMAQPVTKAVAALLPPEPAPELIEVMARAEYTIHPISIGGTPLTFEEAAAWHDGSQPHTFIAIQKQRALAAYRVLRAALLGEDAS